MSEREDNRLPDFPVTDSVIVNSSDAVAENEVVFVIVEEYVSSADMERDVVVEFSPLKLELCSSVMVSVRDLDAAVFDWGVEIE